MIQYSQYIEAQITHAFFILRYLIYYASYFADAYSAYCSLVFLPSQATINSSALIDVFPLLTGCSSRRLLVVLVRVRFVTGCYEYEYSTYAYCMAAKFCTRTSTSTVRPNGNTGERRACHRATPACDISTLMSPVSAQHKSEADN